MQNPAVGHLAGRAGYFPFCFPLLNHNQLWGRSRNALFMRSLSLHDRVPSMQQKLNLTRWILLSSQKLGAEGFRLDVFCTPKQLRMCFWGLSLLHGNGFVAACLSCSGSGGKTAFPGQEERGILLDFYTEKPPRGKVA